MESSTESSTESSSNSRISIKPTAFRFAQALALGELVLGLSTSTSSRISSSTSTKEQEVARVTLQDTENKELRKEHDTRDAETNKKRY